MKEFLRIFWNRITDRRHFCKPGEHKFTMDSAPYFDCKKCGLWNDEYDFKNKINRPYRWWQFWR